MSISDSDRSPALDYVATVHHGIDVAELPENPGGDSLVTLGRIHPDKGTDAAIAIARACGRRLVICGPVQDRDYFEERVRPAIDGTTVTYLGSVGPAERARVLGEAAVLLHPIGFDEPFGLSVAEAMMCGTPVVAYRRSSMPEVVDEGVTGYLADDVEQAVSAVSRAVLLDRRAVRAQAISRFGVDRMVDGYLAVYEKVLGQQAARSAGRSSSDTDAPETERSRIRYGMNSRPAVARMWAPHVRPCGQASSGPRVCPRR